MQGDTCLKPETRHTAEGYCDRKRLGPHDTADHPMIFVVARPLAAQRHSILDQLGVVTDLVEGLVQRQSNDLVHSPGEVVLRMPRDAHGVHRTVHRLEVEGLRELPRGVARALSRLRSELVRWAAYH